MAKPDGTPPANHAHDHGWQIPVELRYRQRLEDGLAAVDHVLASLQSLNLAVSQLDQIRRALVKTVQDQVEQNRRPGLPAVTIMRAFVPETGRATSAGAPGAADAPGAHAQPGEQSVCGWGFFLVQRQVTEATAPGDENYDVIELFLYREGDQS